jgi:hypothetical protein
MRARLTRQKAWAHVWRWTTVVAGRPKCTSSAQAEPRERYERARERADTRCEHECRRRSEECATYRTRDRRGASRAFERTGAAGGMPLFAKHETRWVAEPWRVKTAEVIRVACPRRTAGASRGGEEIECEKREGRDALRRLSPVTGPGPRSFLLRLLLCLATTTSDSASFGCSASLPVINRRISHWKAVERQAFLALDRMPVQSLSLPCALTRFLTCSTRSSRAPQAALPPLLTQLCPSRLAHRTEHCRHVLSGMMIDTSRRGVSQQHPAV